MYFVSFDRFHRFQLIPFYIAVSEHYISVDWCRFRFPDRLLPSARHERLIFHTLWHNWSFLWYGAVFATYMMSGLGITAGAHRLWAHRAYRATLPLRVLLAVFNSMAFQVSLTPASLCLQCCDGSLACKNSAYATRQPAPSPKGGAHPGGYDPRFELGRDFWTMHLPPCFIILCLVVWKLSCWQTNKQTSPKTSKAVRYATTLG